MELLNGIWQVDALSRGRDFDRAARVGSNFAFALGGQLAGAWCLSSALYRSFNPSAAKWMARAAYLTPMVSVYAIHATGKEGSSPTARKWALRFGDQISNSFYGITMLCGLKELAFGSRLYGAGLLLDMGCQLAAERSPLDEKWIKRIAFPMATIAAGMRLLQGSWFSRTCGLVQAYGFYLTLRPDRGRDLLDEISNPLPKEKHLELDKYEIDKRHFQIRSIHAIPDAPNVELNEFISMYSESFIGDLAVDRVAKDPEHKIAVQKGNCDDTDEGKIQYAKEGIAKFVQNIKGHDQLERMAKHILADLKQMTDERDRSALLVEFALEGYRCLDGHIMTLRAHYQRIARTLAGTPQNQLYRALANQRQRIFDGLLVAFKIRREVGSNPFKASELLPEWLQELLSNASDPSDVHVNAMAVSMGGRVAGLPDGKVTDELGITMDPLGEQVCYQLGYIVASGLFDEIYDVEHAFKTAKEAINGDPGKVDGVRTNQYVHARLMTEWLKNRFPDETDEWYDESGCLTDWYVIAFMIESGIINKRSSS